MALLLCPVDQDLSCRALGARVVRGDATVEWTPVGWQVDYEDFAAQPDEYGPLLSFRFDRTQCETLLRTLLSEYEALAARVPVRPPVESSRRRGFALRRRK